MNIIYNYINQSKGFCVNIGASDGVDICDKLFKDGYDGICIEPINVQQAREYVKTLPGEVTLVTQFANPENIHEILKTAPKDLDFLKMDIDGYDLEVMRKIFEHGYVPKVLVMEINETIPPPIQFEIPYDHNWRFVGDHLFGCSVQSVQNVMNKNGYKIIDISDEYQRNNIVAVKSKDVIGNEGIKLWEELYKNEPTTYLNLPWNIDVRHWLDDHDTCQQDLRNLFFNRKYGTNIHTSLHEEPLISGPFKSFITDLLKKNEIKTAVDVGTWNKAGFSRLVIEFVLEHEKSLGLYKLESSSRYLNEIKHIWETNYGNVVNDFAVLAHGRLISNKKYEPPEGYVNTKQYETFYHWTMQAKECNIAKAEIAFVHVYPLWITEVVTNLEKSGVRYIAMMKYMNPSIPGWEIIYFDDEYMCLQRH